MHALCDEEYITALRKRVQAMGVTLLTDEERKAEIINYLNTYYGKKTCEWKHLSDYESWYYGEEPDEQRTIQEFYRLVKQKQRCRSCPPEGTRLRSCPNRGKLFIPKPVKRKDGTTVLVVEQQRVMCNKYGEEWQRANVKTNSDVKGF